MPGILVHSCNGGDMKNVDSNQDPLFGSAWMDGFKAAINGKCVTDNPFDSHSTQWVGWVCGYQAAERDIGFYGIEGMKHYLAAMEQKNDN